VSQLAQLMCFIICIFVTTRFGL